VSYGNENRQRNRYDTPYPCVTPGEISVMRHGISESLTSLRQFHYGLINNIHLSVSLCRISRLKERTNNR